MCSKMRFVSVVATSREALRFLTTKSRRSSADLAARWIWKSLTPARKNTFSTPGSAANRRAKEPMPGRALGGVPGVHAAKVAVIGAGVSGLNAAAIAVGMQADVLLLDRNIDRLRAVDQIYRGQVRTVASNAFEIERAVLDANLVIGAVLIPGAKAPTLVTNELVSRMKPGSVLVDISIDQGGCFEDSHPTTHAHPTYTVHNSVFYCVANMPGAVPNTSTHALTNVTLPYAVALANQGWRQACADDASLALGVNTHAGHLVNAAVGEATGLPAVSLRRVLTSANC